MHEIAFAAWLAVLCAWILGNPTAIKYTMTAFMLSTAVVTTTVLVPDEHVCVKVAFQKWAYGTELDPGLHFVWPSTTAVCFWHTAANSVVRGPGNPQRFNALRCRAGASRLGSPVILFPNAIVRYRVAQRELIRRLFAMYKTEQLLEYHVKTLVDAAVQSMCMLFAERDLLQQDTTPTVRKILQELAADELPGVIIESFRWMDGTPRPESEAAIMYWNTVEIKNTSEFAQIASKEAVDKGIAQAPRWSHPFVNAKRPNQETVH